MSDKQSYENLKNDADKFKTIFENANDIICYTDTDFNVLDINSKVEEIFGYKKEDVIGTALSDWAFLDTGDIEKNKHIISDMLSGKSSHMMEVEIHLDNRPVSFIEVNSRPVKKKNKITGILHIIRDVTRRKKAEQALKEHRDHLDNLVKERTADLEETNTALKVLLKKREEDKKELEHNVITNVKQLILPYIDKLKNGKLYDSQQSLISILETNINDIVSPLAGKLSSLHYSLTPTELDVANLVKQGKTTKEISQILNSSIRAVEFHRNNIRTKLGINHKKTNLRSYLSGLD